MARDRVRERPRKIHETPALAGQAEIAQQSWQLQREDTWSSHLTTPASSEALFKEDEVNEDLWTVLCISVRHDSERDRRRDCGEGKRIPTTEPTEAPSPSASISLPKSELTCFSFPRNSRTSTQTVPHSYHAETRTNKARHFPARSGVRFVMFCWP